MSAVLVVDTELLLELAEHNQQGLSAYLASVGFEPTRVGVHWARWAPVGALVDCTFRWGMGDSTERALIAGVDVLRTARHELLQQQVVRLEREQMQADQRHA